MAHHGDDPNAFSGPLKDLIKQMPERKLDHLREMQSPFGATGRYPQGKLNEDDEGEIQFGVANDGKKVLIKFGKPVAWMGMDAAQARDLAAILIKHADEIGR